MPHETALIATIAAGIGLAFVFALLATRLKLPPLVGYVLAGIAIGPFTPGFIADSGLAQQLSEIGVILLMFGVGIHFSLADLLAVRRIALPGAVVQIAIATALGTVIALVWGWSWGAGLVFGLCLSVASTVVLLRAMESRGMLDSVDGRIAVGWLIVEDLATVLVLVLLPALAVPLGGAAPDGAPGGLAMTVAATLGKVTAFVVLMLVVGRRVVPWLLERVARMGSREMFTLAVLAVALGIAFGAAALFGVSFALGAFLAGMVVNGSDLSHEAASDALPLQDAFSVLFFVAVGMLFDPQILIDRPFAVLSVVLVVMIGKSIAAFAIVLAFRYPVRTALTISASLAQIGEFSFILAALALSLGLLPPEGQSLIVAGAILSISLNPVAFWAADRASRGIASRPRLRAAFERGAPAVAPLPSAQDAQLRDHAIIAGYGRVGSAIGDILARQGIPFVAIDHDRDVVLSLRERGRVALFGDAARAGVLQQAHPERARLLVVATPDPFQARAVVDRARAANPGIEIVARAHSDEQRSYLERHGARIVLVGEHELAFALAHHVLMQMGCGDDAADAAIDHIRRHRVATGGG
jgi:monovalent cation:H+ antiporter-2, CPA2 family